MNTVIFACIHNAGRSQIAAAWFNALAASGRATAKSAGTDPAPHVHPVVIEAMREVGIDLASAKPQKLTDELAASAQILVTMGCGEQCPAVPGLRREDWPLEDPKGKSLEHVRKIRDEVRRRVIALLRREGWGRMVIRAAVAKDRPGVETLLTAANLPVDGVIDHFDTFVVADDEETIVGAAGLELHDKYALLRSVVVAGDARNTGAGSLLTQRLLDRADARGVAAVYLLTTTAERFFPRFGFERIERDEVPTALRASREFQGACPASATAMRRVRP